MSSQAAVTSALLLLGALVAAGCASPTHEPARRARRIDASLDAQEQLPNISLTLWPIYEPSEEATGTTRYTALDGVNVCVARARPIGKTRWRDFVETPGLCSVTRARGDAGGDPVVLSGVPAMSELIVTADKAGYRSSVFAVTTGSADMDWTPGGVFKSNIVLQLRRLEDVFARIPVSASAEMGDLTVHVLGKVLNEDGAWLGGATVTVGYLDGAKPTSTPIGPFYSAFGRPVPGASTTLPGPYPPPLAPAHEDGTGASFGNMEEGEYLVRVKHPHANCRVNGSFFGDVDMGYASGEPGGVRAPVLLGHSTPWIEEICFCTSELETLVGGDAGGRFTLDPTTCQSPDAGAP